MTSAFSVNSQPRPADVLVSLSGEFDLLAAPQVTAVLKEHREEGQPVVVDLAGLTFLDSSGIGVLLEAHRLAPSTISFVVPTGQPLRTLELCGLMAMLPWAGARASG